MDGGQPKNKGFWQQYPITCWKVTSDAEGGTYRSNLKLLINLIMTGHILSIISVIMTKIFDLLFLYDLDTLFARITIILCISTVHSGYTKGRGTLIFWIFGNSITRSVLRGGEPFLRGLR